MKIFISHALVDQELIKGIKQSLEPHGLTLFIAEHYEDIERTITEKIENMIKQSDIALILLTKNGYKSVFVQQEIGYIQSQKKPYLQVVQTGLEKKIKGFNYGRGYVLLDPKQPNLALEKVKRSLLSYWKKKDEEHRQKLVSRKREIERKKDEVFLQQLEEKRRKDEAAAKLVLGGLATFLVLGLLNGNGK